VRYHGVHEPRGRGSFRERFEDEEFGTPVLGVRPVEVRRARDHAVRFPAFDLVMSAVAISARTAPFLLQGAYGVCSVIGTCTSPYMYTLSKKISLARVSLQASIVLP